MNKALSFAAANARNSILKKVSTKTPLLLTKPMQVSINPTNRCNVECVMCDCWLEKQDYVTYEDVIHFLTDLRDWIGNDFFVQIAGGEPLVFKGIYDIFRFCSDNDIICKTSTNGYGLNPAVCDQIIDSGLRYLSVSLDSHIPEVHDRYRGITGTFDRAIAGLKYLRENSDITLGVSVIIMQENIKHIKECTEYLLALDIDRILFQPIRDYYNPIEKWLDYEYWVKDIDALNEAMDYLIAKKETTPKLLNNVSDFEMFRDYFVDPYTIVNTRDCYIGYEQLFVDDKGDITMCQAYDVIGNIKDRDIKDKWKSKLTNDLRESMVGCNLPCTSNCKRELTVPQKVQKFMHMYRSGLFR